MVKFIGRKNELQTLINIAKKKTTSFIVIRGRRRIGKSRLIEEFAKSFDMFYSFIGLAPEKHVTKQDQLDEFSRQISQQFKTAYATFNNWSDALWSVGERVQSGKIILAFDEISWMGSQDHAFLGYIKNFWDMHLKKNPQLVFVVCGSASSWIEKNILSSTGFVGRISYTLTLDELPLSDCNLFWLNKNVSAYEKFKILAVTGGIPRYLEEIDPKISAEENIKQLCFIRGGMLVEEFRQIFSDLFLRESQLYRKILEALVTYSKERIQLCNELDIKLGGRVSEYLMELELSGFITRDFTWNIKTGVDLKQSQYRLKDNYFRFYLKYIAKNLSKIQRNAFNFKSLTSLIEWSTIMGLQFENIVLNNRHLIHKSLGLTPDDIIVENPFYQHKTTRYSGCQIDYMIQTKFNTLYICEIKFSKSVINSSIIDELQQKINTLQYPKGFSCRAVLIHVNGVTNELLDSEYFATIIDMSKFLNE